jgi:hypothetical protein
MLCSALSLLWYLVFVVAYAENPGSLRYVEANGRSFLTAKFEILGQFLQTSLKVNKGITIIRVYQKRMC